MSAMTGVDLDVSEARLLRVVGRTSRRLERSFNQLDWLAHPSYEFEIGQIKDNIRRALQDADMSTEPERVQFVFDRIIYEAKLDGWHIGIGSEIITVRRTQRVHA